MRTEIELLELMLATVTAEVKDERLPKQYAFTTGMCLLLLSM
jgi:hypothetical protein